MKKEAWPYVAALFLIFNISAFAQKQALVEASLKDIRDPKVLDSLAEKLLVYKNDSVLLGRAYFLKGMAGTYSAQPALAAKNFQKCLSYLEPGKEYDERFSYEVVLKNLGISYYRQRDFKSGDSSFRQLKALALAQNDSLKYALAIKGMANSLMMRQSFDSAAVLMKESTLILQNIEYRGISSAYLSLGSIYGRIFQEDQALKWFRKALQSNEKLGDKRMEARVYNNMAVAHRALDRIDSANFYLHQALELQLEIGSILDQVEVYANLARNHARLKEWDKAQEYRDKAWDILPKNEVQAGNSHLNLWLLSLRLANNKQDSTAGAPYFDSLQMAVPRSRLLQDPELMDAFAGHYELIGKSDSALKYLRLSKARDKELQVMRTGAEIKKAANDLEMAALRKEQEGELRGYQMAILVVISFLAIGGLWLWKSRRTVARVHNEKLESESVPAETQVSLEGFTLVDEHKSPSAEAAIETPSQLKLKSKAIINIQDLIYLESDGHYVNLFLEGRNNPEVERSSLKAMDDQLKSYDFVRIHRSYLINAERLKAVYATKVLLDTGVELPLSRTYKEDLNQRFNGEA